MELGELMKLIEEYQEIQKRCSCLYERCLDDVFHNYFPEELDTMPLNKKLEWCANNISSSRHYELYKTIENKFNTISSIDI